MNSVTSGRKHIVSALLVVITLGICMMQTQVEAVGKGCAQSSCGWHNLYGGPCKTSTTGQAGRTKVQQTYSCIFGKQSHLCCDPDCEYKKCGFYCEKDMDGSWESKKPPQPCEFEVDGKRYSGMKHFCCGKKP